MNDPNAGAGPTSPRNDKPPSTEPRSTEPRSTPPGDEASGMAAKSHEVAEQLKDAVVDQANQMRDRAQSAREHTADRIRGVATQFRSMGDTLREGDPFVATAAARASDGIERVANYVGAANTQSVIRDAEALARRQPLWFFGGAFMAGLVAGRFLKSSRPEATSQAGSRAQGDHRQGEAPRLEERPSSFVPRTDATLPGTESATTRYDATFGRDLPDLAHAGEADAAMRSPGTGSTGSPSMGSHPARTVPMPTVSVPGSPPRRKRDENGGGAGKGTLP